MRPSVMGVARSLNDAGFLQRFVTTFAFGNGTNPAVASYLPKPLRTKVGMWIKGREAPEFLGVPLETFPARELLNLVGRRSGLSEVSSHRLWEWAETSFDRKVAAQWAGRAPCLYGCEHASVRTFEKQREAGGVNILWQVIAHHRTTFGLLAEEYDRFPEAMTPYMSRLFEDAKRINDRKDRQYATADLIVTNSEFSRQTFIDAGISAEKVKAVPTGCPPLMVHRHQRGEPSIRKMVFLSAGTQSLRKGIPYLLSAWRQLNPGSRAELWLVGKMELPERVLANLPENVIIKTAVARHEMDQLFSRVDVLVLPTLCEGLAHVILEAMAAGLAVITTENSGCGDLVESGINGWKVPIRDVELLTEKMAWCLENPSEVSQMGKVSTSKAQNWQEEHFAAAHSKLIEVFLAQNGIAHSGQNQAPASAN